MKRTALLLFAAAVFAVSPLCHGRIFFRWRSSARSTKAMLDAGGRLAYETDVTVNGGKGHLTVVSFARDLTDVVEELKRIFDGISFACSGDGMATANLVEKDVALRLLAIHLADPVQTLVFKLEQDPSDFRASGSLPPQHLLPGIPAYPGSDPVFFAQNRDTGAGVAVAKATCSPGSVWSFFAARLGAEGWSAAFPGGDGPGMAVYLKGQRVCCVLVEQSDVPGECRITLLHKEGRGH